MANSREIKLGTFIKEEDFFRFMQVANLKTALESVWNKENMDSWVADITRTMLNDEPIKMSENEVASALREGCMELALEQALNYWIVSCGEKSLLDEIVKIFDESGQEIATAAKKNFVMTLNDFKQEIKAVKLLNKIFGDDILG